MTILRALREAEQRFDAVPLPRRRQAEISASTILEAQLSRARGSFPDFMRFAMRNEKGRPLTPASLHKVMSAHVEACWDAGLHAAILAPFGHGKSVSMVVGRAAYELGRDPSLRIKIVCNGDARARERVMGVGALISSPPYRALFPRIRPVSPERQKKERALAQWTQHAIYVDRPGGAIDPSIHAAGIFSQGTGGRADVLFFDDIADHENSINKPELRSKVISTFEGVWLQRLTPAGRALFVGTPYHEADVTHDLMKRPGWSLLRIWVAEDFGRLEMEVYNPPQSYPIPRRIDRMTRTIFEDAA